MAVHSISPKPRGKRVSKDAAWLAAKEAKQPTFTSATPCGECGGTLRYTANKSCVACHRINSKMSRRRIHGYKGRA